MRLAISLLIVSLVATSPAMSGEQGNPIKSQHKRSEPPVSTNAARYVAKIKFLKVSDGKEVIAVETEVIGTKGTPLKATLGSKNELTLKVEMQDTSCNPSRYVAQFNLVEIKGDKTTVLSRPTLMTTIGEPAKILLGKEKGDRLEVDFTVREIASTANEPKSPAHGLAKSEQPPVSAASSLGTSLMMMVNPRIIIQEEEEPRVPSP